MSERFRDGLGHIVSLLASALAGLLFLTGCGKESREAGDLYVPAEVTGGSFEEGVFLTQCCFKVRDGWLYCMNDGIYRIPIEEELNFEHREIVASREELLGPEEEAVLCYTVDAEESLYYCAFSWMDMIPVLYKRTADGREAYRVPLEKEESLPAVANKPRMAVDAGGNLYVLSRNELLRFDTEGNLTGTLALEETVDGALAETYLLEVYGGQSLLVRDDEGGAGSRRVCRILEGDRPGLEDLGDAMGKTGKGLLARLYEGGMGPLIQENDGCLYRYDTETDTREKMLCWEDCDIYSNDIQAVMQLSGERLLLLQSEIRPPIVKQSLLLLTRTSADQMVQKEQLVLASLNPSNDLEKAVVQFNLSSDQYHVVIERYGNDDGGDDNGGALTRLDSALTSQKETPDLLDLTALDLMKYVDAGALADLYPYIEGSGGIRKGDYLPNLLEGYTFDGKLVCIPKGFRFLGVYVTDGRFTGETDWTMESLMAAADRLDVRLLPEGWYRHILSGFLGGYLLEEYVDWDKGECRFDSDAFRGLLEWVRGQQAREDSGAWLVTPAYVNGYDGYQEMLMNLGEGAVLRGIPSAGGREWFEVAAENALGITAHSANGEGAWEFLHFYLQNTFSNDILYDFPTSPAILDQAEAKIVTPQYRTAGADGEQEEMPRKVMYADGVRTEYFALPGEDADALREVLGKIDFRPWSTPERSVLSIVEEEAAYYLNGEKTVEEVSRVIQNRAELLVQENR